MKTILLGTCEPVLRILAEELRKWQPARAEVDGVPLGQEIVKLLLCDDQEDARQSFPRFAQMFSGLVNQPAIVIVARANPRLLIPLRHYGHESLLAMLILAFPEVRWLFCALDGYETYSTVDGEAAVAAVQRRQRIELSNAQINDFRKAHGLHNLFCPNQSPLFDGAGLRDWVRQRSAGHADSKCDAKYLARRTKTAIALDEETPYSHLHAYTAYRFGFRAAAVTSAKLADHLLGENSTSALPSLVFEDIYVNFADGESGMSWLDLESKSGKGRSTQWRRLEKAEHRIFVTSGQRVPGDGLKWASNAAYLSRQKAEGKPIETLTKPYAGIFRLWEGSELVRKLRWPDPTGKVRRGFAEDFIWPPPKESFTDEEHHGHSSPGVLLVIAESLIERAEQLLEDGVHSVPNAVRGAVLANDALELLGGRTPTVAVEALRLKHHFEVLAECEFAGVEHHICMKERLDEIRRDVGAISCWFGREQQTTAVLNAEMKILLDLVRLLRDQAQFDEEQEVMRRVRYLQNTLWMHKPSWRKMFWPMLRYFELLLSSFPRFLMVIGGWIVLLSALYSVNRPSFYHGLADSITSFFSVGGPIDPSYADFHAGGVVVICLAVVSGFVHLGIFISHLYTLVSRK